MKSTLSMHQDFYVVFLKVGSVFILRLWGALGDLWGVSGDLWGALGGHWGLWEASGGLLWGPLGASAGHSGSLGAPGRAPGFKGTRLKRITIDSDEEPLKALKAVKALKARF